MENIDIPKECVDCPYREFNDYWCIIMEIDCYRRNKEKDKQK